MNRIDDNKRKQINDILSVVKLASLLFSGIAIFRVILDYFKVTEVIAFSLTIQFILISILVLILVYFLWAFSTAPKLKEKYLFQIQIIESLLFILIFFVIILLSGAEKSQFKFLFLFIIITTTIQSGMKRGLITAGISSTIILMIDLFHASSSAINYHFENDLILAGVFLLTAWPLGFYVKTENDHIKMLQNLANEDGLTGLYNHRYFHDALSEEIKSNDKENKPVSLVFIDIDYFKHYNDLYGHQKGDMVLQTIGSLLKNNVREGDIAARYGGEEFALILPGTSEQDALAIAENIRYKIESTYFEGEENQPKGKITASIGLSIYPEKAKNDVELLKSADDALYRAKFFNKNRVEIYYSILDEIKKDIEEKHIDVVTSIKTLISVINAKDKYTYAHVERVVIYCRLLADKLGLNAEDKKILIYGAYMHDIGKISIPEELLNKKMPLTDEERDMMESHPMNGAKIIESVETLKEVIPLILHHHERYDGNGYPDRLIGENIPYLARALAITDSFDAMTSSRPYSNRRTYEEAVEELKRCSGTQFDPAIANAFIEVIKENRKGKSRF